MEMLSLKSSSYKLAFKSLFFLTYLWGFLKPKKYKANYFEGKLYGMKSPVLIL